MFIQEIPLYRIRLAVLLENSTLEIYYCAQSFIISVNAVNNAVFTACGPNPNS